MDIDPKTRDVLAYIEAHGGDDLPNAAVVAFLFGWDAGRNAARREEEDLRRWMEKQQAAFKVP